MPHASVSFKMKDCQTCGSEGFSNLLICCDQCHLVAAHRYCVDGPSTIDDDEVSWSCEDCVPRKLKHTLAFRKSERIHSLINARRNRKNNLALSKVEKSNCVRKRVNKVADGGSNLDEMKKGIFKSKLGKMIDNGTAISVGDSESASLLRNEKKVLNSDDAVSKESSEPFMLKGKMIKDLNISYVDSEDLQMEREQLSQESNQGLESTSKGDEISNSVAENWKKSGLQEEQGILSLLSAKQPTGVEDKASDTIEKTKAVSASHQKGDKKSSYTNYDFQTRRKKRRLVIAMEYSDSDKEPVYVRTEHLLITPQVGDRVTHLSNGERCSKIGDNALAQHSFMKSDDHLLATRPSPIKSDKLTTSSKEFDNCIFSPLSLYNHVPAQPIMNAIWRGHCTICDDVRPMSFGLEAHLSNKAHEKVFGAASALPNSLSFKILQKHDAWPKSFEKSPPTGETIGLYFFPVDERDEKRYDILLEEMIDGELVLKSHINNLELLVFCSDELPHEQRRFRSKYYLWGVFKQKHETCMGSLEAKA